MSNVERYGYRTVFDRMDAHVARENARPEPRRTINPRDKSGKFKKSQHFPITKGKTVKRGEVVHYPYGGVPNETIKRPSSAKKQWKQRVREQRDQIGSRVARESSAARQGCALIRVHHTEATALAYKIRAALKGGQIRDTSKHIVRHAEANAIAYKIHAALKGGQIRDTSNHNAESEPYRARSERVLETLADSARNRTTVTIGVYTREELRTIARQRTRAKHYTQAVRNLERKLNGKG